MPQFDVFLSHNSVDKPWVIKLKNDLLRYGVSVWLDKDEIQPGDLFAKALEEGLVNSRAVALVVSPEAMDSGWVEEEYYHALGLAQSKQFPLRLIPVMLRDAELPGFLKERRWVDFRDETTYTQSVCTLVWGITGKKPAQVLDLTSPNEYIGSGEEIAPYLPKPEPIELHASDLMNSDSPITTKRSTYRIVSVLARGDLATIYEGVQAYCDKETTRVCVKVANDTFDNDLLQQEVQILKLFEEETEAQSKHIPTVIDVFEAASGHWGTVLELIDGFDLVSIREKYPNGVPQEHVVWIFQRALSALGFAHSKGVIHANIEPTHLMVRPRDHNLYLIDWSCALLRPAQTGQTFICLNEEYSAPEVAERKLPLPASDLYSLGRTMVYLLGGDLQTNSLPDSVDPDLVRFIEFFLRNSPRQRAQDAWEMHQELVYLRTRIFGEHEFLEFAME
jgi:hypothetical protein